jgi:hypothetical protein
MSAEENYAINAENCDERLITPLGAGGDDKQWVSVEDLIEKSLQLRARIFPQCMTDSLC